MASDDDILAKAEGAAPAPAVDPDEDILAKAERLDPRGRPYDPRFAPEPDEKTPAQKRTFPATGDLASQIGQAKQDVANLHFGRHVEGAGFFERAFRSAAQGGHALAHVASDVGAQAIQDAQDRNFLHPLPAEKRRELLRGVDDITTLGYGQKLAARIGNAAGDKAETALGPETFGAAVPGQRFANGGAPVPNTQASDAAAAPEYRPAGQFLGGFVPGAGKALGQAAGDVVGSVLPEAKGLAAAGTLGAAKGLLSYEASAPVAAGLSASAEGDRFGAVHQAATDPLGILASTVPGAVAESGKAATLGSKGAKARELIEREGQGATVSPFSPGTGGVFDRELAGVPANDRGIGMAAKIGAKQIVDTIEQQFEDTHGFPYREGPAVVKEAANSAKEQAQLARQSARAADIAYREDVAAAKNAVQTETSARAKQILANIEEEHQVETSRPYRVLKNMIDNSEAARTPRDVAPIVASMQDAVNDLETAPFVRSQLVEQLKILEHYRDPQTEAIMVPERQLNGLRRTLMRSAKVGMSDAPGEADAPLRQAAFVAKQMVDDGPYAALNRLYSEGTAKREVARKAVGLKGKPARDAAADEKRLTSNIRGLVKDETAIPGPLPPEADVSAVRAALKAPEARREAAMAKVRAQLAAAEKIKADVAGHVAAAAKAAEADRAMLGLNSKIGTRKTDVNQIRLALQRQGENTGTAGGSAGAEDALTQYIAAHPEAKPSAMLSELQRAKADLSYRLLPHHGKLRGTVGATVAAGALGALAHTPLAGLAAPAYLAVTNATPIAGRVLYPLAKNVDAAAAGGRLGGAMGAAPSADDVFVAREIQRLMGEGVPIATAVRMARGALQVQQGASP